jgi:CheY-like chemotaxis protein
MDTFDTFRAQVLDALRYFYDPVHIQTHALRRYLPSDAGSGSQGAALRQALLEAIEGLRPAASIPVGGPEWLGYLIVRRRYIEALSPSDVCDELGLSRASFYRHHRDALDAVASILWERSRAALAERAEPGPPLRNGLSPAQQEATRLARALPVRSVAVDAIAEGVRQVIEPLAEKKGVALEMEVPETPLHAYGDATMLRQSLINVLSEVIRAAEGDRIECSVRAKGDEIVWRLAGAHLGLNAADLEQRNGFAVARSLLGVYGGQVQFEDQGSAVAVVVTMSTHQARTVLVIDDDRETVRLYRQYLSDQDCAFVGVHTGDEAWAALERIVPDLILLDVLMPGEDGWAFLQRLKTWPATASIPVVICSVLSQPDLALALGALAVLQKPVARADLARVTNEIMARDSRS